MGLTNSSVGKNAIDSQLKIVKKNPTDYIVTLAGNPNVGKSTVFNALTGMKQHTGNWPGKTVSNAFGYCSSQNNGYVFADVPGTYSLMAHSAEEEVARNFICFGGSNAVIVVCDATCLERNMNLVLQTIETGKKVLVCVNLMDEAKRRNIDINFDLLSERLGINVVGTSARNKKTLSCLLEALDNTIKKSTVPDIIIEYPEIIEKAIENIQKSIEDAAENCNCGIDISTRWLALKLLEGDKTLTDELYHTPYGSVILNCRTKQAIEDSWKILTENGYDREKFRDAIVLSIVRTAENVCSGVVLYTNRLQGRQNEHKRNIKPGSKKDNTLYGRNDINIDRILTSRAVGYPVMIVMLVFVLWLTIVASNYPSELLSNLLFRLQNPMDLLLLKLRFPDWLRDIIINGVYRVLAWVVSVMLPPMAVFFPLFSLLEDLGYLPRIAYNLDKPLKKCSACGKQALTMCMGFGCNAAGVVGCRIIDSPRERLLAIITNSFVPCNGRFPIFISIISMFFIGYSTGLGSTFLSALAVAAVIVLGIILTLAVTKLLAVTLLRGTPSSFTLELPPYRRPELGRIIVRSLFDRTWFVLRRAVAVAAPAGLVIWFMANCKIGEISLLRQCSDFLDPFAKLMGLDGVILIAFILGFPANEIVMPIIIMAYTAGGTLVETESMTALHSLLAANGWTWKTALCTMIFTLSHWPCSTTLLTIKKETGSMKWTVLSALIPTVCSILLCMLINLIFYFFDIII